MPLCDGRGCKVASQGRYSGHFSSLPFKHVLKSMAKNTDYTSCRQCIVGGSLGNLSRWTITLGANTSLNLSSHCLSVSKGDSTICFLLEGRSKNN